MDQEAELAQPDVVPDYISRSLAVAWIVLFGGRWCIIYLLLMMGYIPAASVVTIDNNLLQPLYLILLGLTALLLILRVIKSRASGARIPIPDDNVVEKSEIGTV